MTLSLIVLLLLLLTDLCVVGDGIVDIPIVFILSGQMVGGGLILGLTHHLLGRLKVIMVTRQPGGGGMGSMLVGEGMVVGVVLPAGGVVICSQKPCLVVERL